MIGAAFFGRRQSRFHGTIARRGLYRSSFRSAVSGCISTLPKLFAHQLEIPRGQKRLHPIRVFGEFAPAFDGNKCTSVAQKPAVSSRAKYQRVINPLVHSHSCIPKHLRLIVSTNQRARQKLHILSAFPPVGVAGFPTPTYPPRSLRMALSVLDRFLREVF